MKYYFIAYASKNNMFGRITIALDKPGTLILDVVERLISKKFRNGDPVSIINYKEMTQEEFIINNPKYQLDNLEKQ